MALRNLHTKLSTGRGTPERGRGLRSSHITKGFDMTRRTAMALGTLFGGAAGLLMADVAFAGDRGFGDGYGRRHHGDDYMFIFPLFLLIAVAALLALLWRNRHPDSPTTATPAASPTLNAQTILADRLARGEISPDDYRAAVAVLRETAPPPAG